MRTMRGEGEYLKFNPVIPEKRGHLLTDEQWLRVITTVDDARPNWAWVWPENPGDPVWVLRPERDRCLKVEPDGTYQWFEFILDLEGSS